MYSDHLRHHIKTLTLWCHKFYRERILCFHCPKKRVNEFMHSILMLYCFENYCLFRSSCNSEGILVFEMIIVLKHFVFCCWFCFLYCLRFLFWLFFEGGGSSIYSRNCVVVQLFCHIFLVKRVKILLSIHLW